MNKIENRTSTNYSDKQTTDTYLKDEQKLKNTIDDNFIFVDPSDAMIEERITKKYKQLRENRVKEEKTFLSEFTSNLSDPIVLDLTADKEIVEKFVKREEFLAQFSSRVLNLIDSISTPAISNELQKVLNTCYSDTADDEDVVRKLFVKLGRISLLPHIKRTLLKETNVSAEDANRVNELISLINSNADRFNKAYFENKSRRHRIREFMRNEKSYSI